MAMQDDSKTSTDLNPRYEDSMCKVSLKLDGLKSVEDYCTPVGCEAIGAINEAVSWLFTTGKIEKEICRRGVDFLLGKGLPKLIAKILQSLTGNAEKETFKVRYMTHSIAWKFLYNLNYISPDTRKQVRIELVKSGVTRFLLRDLESCDPRTEDPRQRTRILTNIYTLRVLTLFGDSPSVVPIYRATKAVDILMRFAESDFTMIKVRSLLLLATIVNEKEVKRIVTTEECVSAIVEMLQAALESEKKRYSFVMNIDGEEEQTFHMSVKGLVEGLNSLSSNDANKDAIMQNEAVPVLASVIYIKVKQEMEVKQEAIEALWKLAFVESNVEVILTHLTFADTAALDGR